MSPELLRRYRADRLLRDEFEALRERVIHAVEGRLRAVGATPDRSDLEAAYAVAWQGLYAAIFEGQKIANPAGWLTVVAHRRAVDEHRARERATPTTIEDAERERAQLTVAEWDMASVLDDRARLRALLEGLRARLSERERQAASLCYLQGLSRAEAAGRMGISESRMRKLMEGAGRGLRGVAAKVGALAQVIVAGEWCEQQGSLMRGLAFGVLDPRGERYRIALDHAGQCPACRAYVRSLRGLAAVLPPSPLVLHWIAAAGAGGMGAATAAGAGAGGGVGAAQGVPGAGAAGPFGPGSAAGGLSAPGAVGAAGGSWWLAGGVGAKLAVGCVLAAGLGAGCIAIERVAHDRGSSKHARRARGPAEVGSANRGLGQRLGATAVVATSSPSAGDAAVAGRGATTTRPGPSESAAREFGPEGTGRGSMLTSAQAVGARSRATAHAAAAAPPASSTRAVQVPGGTAGSGGGSGSAAAAPAAQREFAPG